MEVTKLKPYQPRFFCLPCDFKCYMKCDWDRHVVTTKHEKVSNGSTFTNVTDKFSCMCGKQFKTHGGLWKHKKKCEKHNNNNQSFLVASEPNQPTNNTDLITYLMNENKELKNMIMELCKTVGKNVI